MPVDLTTRKPGRPTSCTPEVQAIIIESVRAGNYISTACQAAGINQSSYVNWLHWAKDVNEALEDIGWDGDTDPEPYIERLDETTNSRIVFWRFFQELKTAEATAETSYVGLIKNAAAEKGGWIAAMTFLERRHPDKWGKRDAVDEALKAGTQLLEKLAARLSMPEQPPALPSGS